MRSFFSILYDSKIVIASGPKETALLDKLLSLRAFDGTVVKRIKAQLATLLMCDFHFGRCV